MRLTLAALVACVLAAALAAQVPADQQKPTFRAGVNFVRVDAYPTANGRAVADLRQDEFEVLEDGVAQAIETFERVAIRGGGLDPLQEPSTVGASNDAAANPRSRVFVLFLDTYHVSSIWSGRLVDVAPTKRALRNLLQRLLGPEDLIALVRPETDVAALSFTRQSLGIEALLNSPDWQRMGDDLDLEPREQQWDLCYPPQGLERHSAIVMEMMARSREQRVLDTLRRLVIRLQTLREERKAILLVSEGWTLFQPNPQLAAPQPGQSIPGPPPVGVGRGGGLTVGRDPRQGDASMRDCDADRLELARLDNARDFRVLADQANRANATFYPISPAGLLAPVNAAGFNRREESLRDLAAATDGIAAVGSNDPAPAVARIAEDTSSYYLLGYSSTNTKLDGRFRKIAVRVKRPGVSVRARRGYLAPTEDEASRRAATAAAVPDAATTALNSALGALDRARPDRVVHIQAGYTWQAAGGGAPAALVWIAGELDAATSRKAIAREEVRISATLQDSSGRTIATGDATTSTDTRSFVISFAGAPVGPGDYAARTVTRSSGEPSSDVARVTVPAVGSSLGSPLLYRRGPFTGPAFQPTADPRFRKAERLRADVSLAAVPDEVGARLVDRKGQPLQVPVAASQRDEEGRRVVSAEVMLAPLAPGDYLIEVTARFGAREEKVLVAFRIVP